jgi:hypothetical protein
VSNEKRWSLIALTLVLIFATTRDASYLFSYPVAVGADGYYYVLQVGELLKSHRLYYASNSPLVFWALAALTTVTRNSVLAIKLGSIIFNISLCLGVFALASTITRSRWAGVLGAGIVALSGMHFYMMAEFIKNLAGVAFFVWAVWCVIHGVETRRVCWFSAALVLLVCAALSHVSIWAIMPAMSALILFTVYFISDKRSKWARLFGVSVVCFGIVSPALVAYQRVFKLPSWLATEVFIRPRIPITLRNPVGKAEIFILLLMVPLALLLLARYWNKAPGYFFRVAVVAVSIWTLLITLNPFLNHDVTELGFVGRLDHLMYLQVAILVPAVISLAVNASRKIVIVPLILTLCFLMATMAAPLPGGLRSSYLAERQQMIQALPSQRPELGQDCSIIARHGDEFLVTWLLGTPAQQNLPSSSEDKAVYWMVHHVNPNSLTTSMIVVMEENDGSALVLMKHSDMIQLVSTINGKDRSRLLVENPHVNKYLDGYSQ